MAVLTNAPRGTQDILPGNVANWQKAEKRLSEVAGLYRFMEIRTPVFEHTELFSRSVGETTDVVQKEMYTFNDKGNRSITLRPEGTAGVIRAVLQNGLIGGALPLKLYYCIPCYRYEKPQAGRLREFHQFGAELLGSASPLADFELISMAAELLSSLGVTDTALRINSIGCPVCRKEYNEKLRAFLLEREDKLCETCRDRITKNPMRVLDCKSPDCQKQLSGAPAITDNLCPECQEHFNSLQALLNAMEIDYTIDPKIVRGLDYYTKTVFEFVSDKIGAQGTVLGGGRYDGLVEELGGPKTPALGFAMGLERILLVMEALGIGLPDEPSAICQVYIASMGDAAALKAQKLCRELRQSGIPAECDCVGRSLKAQMKYADKLGARYTVVLGDDELQGGECVMKSMTDKRQLKVSLISFLDEVTAALLSDEYDKIIGDK